MHFRLSLFLPKIYIIIHAAFTVRRPNSVKVAHTQNKNDAQNNKTNAVFFFLFIIMERDHQQSSHDRLSFGAASDPALIN